MSTNFKLTFALLWPLGVVPCCAGATPPVQLQIAPFQYVDGGSISFQALPLDLERVAATENIGQTEHFQVYSGPTPCTYDDAWRQYSYDLFLRQTSTGQWFHFQVNAVPSAGSFLDGFHTLDFTITDAKKPETGKIRLPLHALGKDPFLIVKVGEKPIPVWLGSENAIPVSIQSKLQDMKLLLQSVDVAYQDPGFWTTQAPQLTPNLNLDEMSSEIFDRIRVRANAGKVILNTSFWRSNAAHTSLYVNIHYSAQAGGSPKQLQVSIPVQFFPSPPILAIAIIGGAFLGAFARLIQQARRSSLRPFLWAVLIASVSAALLELIGIVLVSLNSEFILFGLKLDPFQFPQVLLMGVLVGVFGVNISDLLRQLLGKGALKAAGDTVSAGGDK